MGQRTAQCSCGQLTVDCRGEPVSVSLCHCTECQRRTGSTYGIAAFFDVAGVEVSGRSRQFHRTSDEGQRVTFHFCPECGSTVFWTPSRLPDRIAVAVGNFSDPSFPAPEKDVFIEHRHHWVPSVKA